MSIFKKGLQTLIIFFFLAGMALCLSAFATPRNDILSSSNRPTPWAITGSLGFTKFNNMYKGDSNTALGRFAIEHKLFRYNIGVIGFEIGVQNGNTMRILASQEAQDSLGGLPIQSTVKPMMDLLITLKTTNFSVIKIPFLAQFKFGSGYRHWQFNDRDTINDLSQWAGEIQSGLGYPINEKASLALLYQGLFGSNPNFILNKTNQTGHVTHIPIQHGVLLGLSITV